CAAVTCAAESTRKPVYRFQMRRWIVVVVVALAACGDSSSSTPSDAAPPDFPAILPDASPTLPTLFRFAVVGDTRPANEDDVGGYPTGVIGLIWRDVEASQPHPD